MKIETISSIRQSAEKVAKECSVCGEKIALTLFPSGRYFGGNYFFRTKTKNSPAEYWECDSCYKK